MQLFMISFITLSFGIAFANGVPVSAGNSYNEEIKSNIDKAVSIAVDQDLAKASNQGLIGSALNGLDVFLKSLLIPYIVSVSNKLPFIKDAIDGALKGASKGSNDGHLVTGILGGLAKAYVQSFEGLGGQIIDKLLEGSDPKKNEEIQKYIDKAVKQAQAKLDEENKCKSDTERNLNNVKELVSLMLRFSTSFVAQYVSTALGSGINGLVEGLAKGLHEDGLFEGISDAAKGLFVGLSSGTYKGFGEFFESVLSSSDPRLTNRHC